MKREHRTSDKLMVNLLSEEKKMIFLTRKMEKLTRLILLAGRCLYC